VSLILYILGSTTGGVVVGVVFLLITIATLVFLYIKNEKFKDFVKGLRESFNTPMTLFQVCLTVNLTIGIPSRVVGGDVSGLSSSRNSGSALAKYETVAQVDEEQSLFDKDNDEEEEADSNNLTRE